MANRFWVGGTDNWDGTAGTKWALTSGGAGGQAVPTSIDNVHFDASSGSVTVTISGIGTDVCNNLDFTGFTGTFSDNNVDTQLNIYGSLTLGAGMTFSLTATNSDIQLLGTGSFNIATNGIIITCSLSPNISGGTWTLQDDLNISNILNVNQGTFNANNKNVNIVTLYSSYATSRTLTMGSGTWILTGTGTVWDCSISTGLTLNCNTSTIKLIGDTTATQSVFHGGGLTYYNFWDASTGTGVEFVYESNTFNNFKIDTGRKFRFYDGTTTTVSSLTAIGSPGNIIQLLHVTTNWTLFCSSGNITVDYCQIWNSTATGGATFNATNSIDSGGNTGWNFITTSSRYWVGGTGDWDTSTTTHWSLTSGGAGGASVPTSSDNVYFDANSGSGIVTLTSSLLATSNLDFTGFTGDFSGSQHLAVYGNLTAGSGMTWSNTGQIIISGNCVITSNGVTISPSHNNGIRIDSVGNTVTLADDLHTGLLFLLHGEFDANNKNVTLIRFDSSLSVLSVRSLIMGSGTWILTGTGTVWDCTTTLGLTLSAGTSTIKITDTSSDDTTFKGGSLTYNNLWFARGTSTGSNIIFGMDTFNDIKDNGSVAHNLLIGDGHELTINTFSVNGSAGNLITLDNTSDYFVVPFGLICASGVISTNYLIVKNSNAFGGATFNAFTSNGNVDGMGNTGWNFGPVITPPVVTTQSVSSISDISALGNGTITSVGGALVDKIGFVFDTITHSNPGNVSPALSGYSDDIERSGSFYTGTFFVGLVGLSDSTTYYGRAYAHNAAGWGYGDEVSFTTTLLPTNGYRIF